MTTPQKKNQITIKDVFKINYKFESPPRPASVPLQTNSPSCYSPYRYNYNEVIYFILFIYNLLFYMHKII